MKQNKVDMTATLFLRESEEDGLEEILEKIMCYLESMYHKYSTYPKTISLSENAYQIILEGRPNIIHDNRIQGMEIEVRREN